VPPEDTRTYPALANSTGIIAIIPYIAVIVSLLSAAFFVV
jgi:hypothetical protein